MAATATVTAASFTRSAPLVLTRDPDLVDTLQSVPGLPFTVLTSTPLQAWHHWIDAPLVVLGADQVAPALAEDMPARPLVVVANGRPVDLVAVARLVTDHGGNRYRADVVRAEDLATVLPALLAREGAR
jgi:hypothetical protein